MPPRTRLQARRDLQQLQQQQQQQQQQEEEEEAQPGLYKDVPAFTYEFASLSNGDYEAAVTGVWLMILNHYFSPSELYIHRAEEKVKKGFVDIDTHQWVDPPANSGGAMRLGKKSCRFLMTQCKRQKYEGRNSVWQEGVTQLEAYMSDKRAWSHPIYGIVAVGRYAQFYQWDHNSNDLVEMTPAHGALHIKKDAEEIHRRLIEILNNHC
ncbi:hypothetical protein DPV78_010548 [Talaromyces pinophilus]|nr:hypothetical protein DPV78_010548 [Talaromyces pinophilus]